MPKGPRRTALLTAVVRQLEAQAVDDALDLVAEHEADLDGAAL
ncbi:hypothetical protein [Streptomyces sp. NPDC086519]